MSDHGQDAASGNRESESDVDSEFRTLLEGLRTSIPAAAVVFSFLLTLPMQSAFAEIRAVERIAFYVAFIAAALATVLLVAPSAHQRVRAPISGIPRRSSRDVAAATWLSIAGTACLAISIGAATYLVSTLVFDDVSAGIVTAIIVAATVWSWFYMPLVTFNKE